VAGLFLATFFGGLPWLFVQWSAARGWPRLAWGPAPLLGAALCALAVGVVIHASSLFRRMGGTPVPVEPPRHLVRSGAYRWSRNPIYLAYVAFVLGGFLLLGDPGLLLYAAVLAVFFHLWVVLWEEPSLARRFGAGWRDYRRRVPRWIGRPAPA
jgi:protein-S-isoprenylcysteine O-methyltransferase Ste14